MIGIFVVTIIGLVFAWILYELDTADMRRNMRLQQEQERLQKAQMREDLLKREGFVLNNDNRLEFGKDICVYVDEISKKLAIEKQEDLLYFIRNFCPSREEIRFESDACFYIDDTSKKFAIQDTRGFLIVGYSNILGYEVKENKSAVIKGDGSSAAAGAVVGGMLLGDAVAGAVIGAAGGNAKIENMCDSMTLCLKLNDIKMPFFEVNLICNTCERNTPQYIASRNRAGEVAALLTIVQDQQTKGELPEGSIEWYPFK